jgi:hypothetical protein
MDESGSKLFSETPEEQRARLDALWLHCDFVEHDPELLTLFNRKKSGDLKRKPKEILQEHGYPERTSIDELRLKSPRPALNPKFIKDGFMYLLRGDHPGIDKKGLYARTYGYGKLSTKQLIEKIYSAQEIGYALYGDERYLTKAKPTYTNKAEELAHAQSARGGSSFISATTSIPCAKAGTGNVPDPAEQAQYKIYVLKIPVEYAVCTNIGDAFLIEEDEVLVPDFVEQDEIVATFDRDKSEDIYQYLNGLLGVTREDVKIEPTHK